MLRLSVRPMQQLGAGSVRSETFAPRPVRQSSRAPLQQSRQPSIADRHGPEICDNRHVQASDELELRESAFAVLRTRMLTQPVFTRDQLADVEVVGERIRLVGTQTGIWKPRQLKAALSIVTGYYTTAAMRPYSDADVLDTFDGPTLQHALKEMHGATLAMVPSRADERPDRGLLEERFHRFLGG